MVTSGFGQLPGNGRPDRKGRTPGFISILLIVSFALIATPALAAFQASVDRNPVGEGESFTLTLNSDARLDGDPDLSVLQKDFDVLGKSSGSSMQIINGSVTRSVQWQIQLMPKHSGNLVIPSIKAGGEATTAIVLAVRKADQARAGQESGELFLEVVGEPRTAYVQQQIIFTVRLFRQVNIRNDSSLSDPQFPGMDAIVEQLGDGSNYQTMRNGQAYAVIERRYAVYPQKSGNFNSAPLQFDGVIVENSRRGGFMFDPFSQSVRQKRVFSRALSFTIKPEPSSMDNQPWLPASSVKLSEQWSENPPTFKVGEPVTRTVVISAQGLMASQLPALGTGAVDGFKFYPDQPALNDNKSDAGNNGVRTQKIAIMPTRTGTFMLPAIEVKWWNVNTDRLETARLPAKTVTVLPGAADANGALPPSGPVADSNRSEVAPTLATTSNALPSSAETLMPGEPMTRWWPWIALFLGTGWLVTLVLLLTRHSRSEREDAGAQKEASLRALESQLKRYCHGNDAPQAKATLLAWAKLRWPDKAPTSLTAMADRCGPGLSSELRALDRSLYSKDNETWRGAELWQLFSQDKPAPTTVNVKADATLKPLFLAQ